ASMGSDSFRAPEQQARLGSVADVQPGRPGNDLQRLVAADPDRAVDAGASGRAAGGITTSQLGKRRYLSPTSFERGHVELHRLRGAEAVDLEALGPGAALLRGWTVRPGAIRLGQVDEVTGYEAAV